MHLAYPLGLKTISKKSPSNFKQGGFSLLEILISSVLFAVIAITVISLVQSSIKTRTDILTRNNEDSQIEIVFSQIERDFSLIYNPILFDYLPEKRKFIPNNAQFSQRTNSGLPIPTMFGESNRFIFFTSSNRRRMANVEQSHFTWIQYQLFGQQLKRFVFPEDPYSYSRFNIDAIRGDVMMENVTEILFEYWEPTQKKFIDRLWDHVKSPLQAIRVTLTWTKNRENTAPQIEKSVRIFRAIWPPFTPTPPASAKKERSQQQQSNFDLGGDDAFNDTNITDSPNKTQRGGLGDPNVQDLQDEQDDDAMFN